MCMYVHTFTHWIWSEAFISKTMEKEGKEGGGEEGGGERQGGRERRGGSLLHLRSGLDHVLSI